MKKRYWKIILGQKPILLAVPHSYPVWREGKIKSRDLFTGLDGRKVVFFDPALGDKSENIQPDPNWYKNSPFRKTVKKIISENNIRAVFDIHGRKSSAKSLTEFYPNSEFKKSFGKYLNNLPKGKFKKNIQLTMTEDLDLIHIPSVEIEIRKDDRTPKNKNFDLVISIIVKLINNTNV